MKPLINDLLRLENVLKTHFPSFPEKLAKGLTNEQVDSNSGFLDSQLSILYKWHNGVKHTDIVNINEYAFFSKGYMMPLEQAIRHYQMFIEINLWEVNYFPVFTNNEGDYILYNKNNTGSNDKFLLYAPVLLLTPKPISIYNSLESLVKSITDCFEQGAYSFNSMGLLKIKESLERSICRQNNPGALFWDRN